MIILKLENEMEKKSVEYLKIRENFHVSFDAAMGWSGDFCRDD